MSFQLYIQMYILYAFQCETLHYTISVKVVLGPNKIMNVKNLKFCFYFCLQYALSHTIPLDVFDFSFLKIILELLSMGFCSAKCNFYFFKLTCYNFKTKWLPIPYSQVIPIFPFLTFVCSCNLHHIHYQCLSQCKLSLNYGKQHSHHPEIEPKITGNSEKRLKLISNNKTGDSSFKGERNC